jgi:uncharacterized membrane protein (UPF0127 family)
MRARLVAGLVAWCLLTVATGVRAEAPTIGRGTVTLPNGAVYAVEIPRTEEARRRGLMFRADLPRRTGMLFVFETTGRYGFWMKNCLISLDLVWIDEAKRVVAILPETPPCKSDPCPIYQFDVPTRYVLEIPSGAAKREGLVVGSVLRFSP